MQRQASPRFHTVKAIADTLGLEALAAIEVQAVRERPVPRRLLDALLRPDPPEIVLSPKERETMVLLVSGFSRQEIADERGVTIETVKHQLKTAYVKLGARNQIEAINAFLERAA